jgi:hypothetical protein
MAAAKANCQKLEKALAEREASMDGPSNTEALAIDD